MMIPHTFLARRNNDVDIDLSSQGGTMKIWTLLKKEKQVEDMDPSQKGETG